MRSGMLRAKQHAQGCRPCRASRLRKPHLRKTHFPLFYKALQTTIVCKSLQTPWGTGRMAVLDTTNVAHCCVPTTVCVHEDSAVVDSVCALVFLVRGLDPALLVVSAEHCVRLCVSIFGCIHSAVTKPVRQDADRNGQWQGHYRASMRGRWLHRRKFFVGACYSVIIASRL